MRDIPAKAIRLHCVSYEYTERASIFNERLVKKNEEKKRNKIMKFHILFSQQALFNWNG